MPEPLRLSAAKAKWIRSLNSRKVRDLENCFLAEGIKILEELLDPDRQLIRHEIRMICATEDWMQENGAAAGRMAPCYRVSPSELQRISSQKSPSGVLAVVEQVNHALPSKCPDLSVGLDCIQDPGNLGTILRTADWFGIRDIFCSPDSADLYNPKVIQASMGSFARVKVHYTDMVALVDRFQSAGECHTYAAAADGTGLYQQPLEKGGLILLGNESRGLSAELLAKARQRISIPAVHPRQHPESLNVASAAAIIFAEFRRQQSASQDPRP